MIITAHQKTLVAMTGSLFTTSLDSAASCLYDMRVPGPGDVGFVQGTLLNHRHR